MAKDYYKILGVKADSSIEEIRKAYRRLARKYHPDVNQGDKSAEEKFKTISEAYQVLSNPDKKAKYDQFGSAFFDGLHNRSGTGRGSPFSNINFGGFSEDVFGGGRSGSFKDFFRDIFNQTATKTEQAKPRKGVDLHHFMEISFLDAARGISANLTIQGFDSCSHCNGTGQTLNQVPEKCPECNGTGERASFKGPLQFRQPCNLCGGTGKIDTRPCATCHGRGVLPKTKKISVKIPAGVDTGSKIRLAGQGEPGTKGGLAGDLLITVKVRLHQYFERSGKNILLKVPITASELILGTRIVVPTPDGKVKMTVPPCAVIDKPFRLQGKGLPDLKGGQKGDLLVTVVVVAPDKVTEKAKGLIREFDHLNPYNPREGLF